MIKINRERIEQSFETEPHFQITLSLPERFKRDFTEKRYNGKYPAALAIENILIDPETTWLYDLETLYALELAISNLKEEKEK